MTHEPRQGCGDTSPVLPSKSRWPRGYDKPRNYMGVAPSTFQVVLHMDSLLDIISTTTMFYIQLPSYFRLSLFSNLAKGAESKFPRYCDDADETQLPGPPVESVLKMGVFRSALTTI